MTSKGNIIEIVLKSSGLSDGEKEKILFEAFDILLSESDSTKTIINNDEVYEKHKKPTLLLAGKED